MKKTLGELLDPGFESYRSIGEMARTLQWLISTAAAFRQRGRWGSSGPHEALINYGGCTNCLDKEWHSSRIRNLASKPGITTWQENHDALYKNLLSAVCGGFPLDSEWQTVHGIGLGMLLNFPMAYQNKYEEKSAWEKIVALHGHRLPVASFNSCHRGVNVLAAPELRIGPNEIKFQACLTLKSELRTSLLCYSRWGVSFLSGQKAPRWNLRSETFAQFTLRSVAFFLNLKPKRSK